MLKEHYTHRDGGKILFRLIDCCPGASTPPCFHAYITLVPLLSSFDAAYQHIVWRWDFGWSQHPSQILPLFWKLLYKGIPYGSISWGNFPHEMDEHFRNIAIYMFLGLEKTPPVEFFSENSSVLVRKCFPKTSLVHFASFRLFIVIPCQQTCF